MDDALPITGLSIYATVIAPLALGPTALRSVRALHLAVSQGAAMQPYLPLLPQLTSLSLSYLLTTQDLNALITASTSLTFLSLRPRHFIDLDTATLLVIKQRITTLKLFLSWGGEVAQTLIKIIEGSAVMKKIILDGSFATATFETTAVMVELFSKFESACKKEGMNYGEKIGG